MKKNKVKKINNRCSWANSELTIEYHDKEWSVIKHDDTLLFEYLFLEIFQSGLKWELILKKRENFRKAFDNFDYRLIAKYTDSKIEELLENRELIRNSMKIKSIINNAKCFIEIQKEFGSFDKYIWSFTENRRLIYYPKDDTEVKNKNELSDKIAKDMKKRGFRFIGSIVIYSYLQAIGIIEEHLITCIKKARM